MASCKGCSFQGALMAFFRQSREPSVHFVAQGDRLPALAGGLEFEEPPQIILGRRIALIDTHGFLMQFACRQDGEPPSCGRR